jgi:hypothetical protein
VVQPLHVTDAGACVAQLQIDDVHNSPFCRAEATTPRSVICSVWMSNLQKSDSLVKPYAISVAPMAATVRYDDENEVLAQIDYLSADIARPLLYVDNALADRVLSAVTIEYDAGLLTSCSIRPTGRGFFCVLQDHVTAGPYAPRIRVQLAATQPCGAVLGDCASAVFTLKVDVPQAMQGGSYRLRQLIISSMCPVGSLAYIPLEDRFVYYITTSVRQQVSGPPVVLTSSATGESILSDSDPKFEHQCTPTGSVMLNVDEVMTCSFRVKALYELRGADFVRGEVAAALPLQFTRRSDGPVSIGSFTANPEYKRPDSPGPSYTAAIAGSVAGVVALVAAVAVFSWWRRSRRGTAAQPDAQDKEMPAPPTAVKTSARRLFPLLHPPTPANSAAVRLSCVFPRFSFLVVVFADRRGPACVCPVVVFVDRSRRRRHEAGACARRRLCFVWSLLPHKRVGCASAFSRSDSEIFTTT